MAKAQRKSEVDHNLESQLRELQQQAKSDHDQRIKAEQQKWMMPMEGGEWDGDLFEWDTMIKKPFKRDEANEQFKKAVRDPENPGVSGDIVITSTQADYLAVMGRAFAARHTMRWPRAMAHALGRRRGHGDVDYGLFQRGILEYVRGLIKQASGAE